MLLGRRRVGPGVAPGARGRVARLPMEVAGRRTGRVVLVEIDVQLGIDGADELAEVVVREQLDDRLLGGALDLGLVRPRALSGRRSIWSRLPCPSRSPPCWYV